MNWKSLASPPSLVILAALLAVTMAYYFAHLNLTRNNNQTKGSIALSNSSSAWSAWNMVDSTAQGAAWLRYIGSKEADPLLRINHLEPVILKYLLPIHLTLLADLHYSREWIKKNFIPGAYEAILARTHYTDKALLNALNTTGDDGEPNLQQLVTLGAGYDTRAFRFHSLLEKQKVKVFEVDLPELQQKKRSLLAKAVASGSFLEQDGDLVKAMGNIAFVPVNFENRTDGKIGLNEMWKRMKEQGYDEKKKTFFVWEGVTAYLSPAAVASTLHSIHHHSAPASMIVFDFFALSPQCMNSTQFQDMAAAAESLNEPFRFIVKIPPIRGDEEEEAYEKKDKQTAREKTEKARERNESGQHIREGTKVGQRESITPTEEELSVSDEIDANQEEETALLRPDSTLISPSSETVPTNSKAGTKKTNQTSSRETNKTLLPTAVPQASDSSPLNTSSLLPVFTPFPSPIEEAWHIRELSRYLSPLGWHLINLNDPAHLERNYLTDSKGNFVGIVACFEHLATARNKRIELEAEVPRIKNTISW